MKVQRRSGILARGAALVAATALGLGTIQPAFAAAISNLSTSSVGATAAAATPYVLQMVTVEATRLPYRVGVDDTMPYVLPTVTVEATRLPYRVGVDDNRGFQFVADTAAPPPPPAGPRANVRERIRERVIERRAGQERAGRAEEDKHLTTDQVRDIVAGNLARTGNDNLKVGKVTAKENSVVAVDIVTKTGALVTTREISTKTGRPSRAADAPQGPGGPRGPGMRGRGGPGMGANRPDLKLTVDQARKLAEARLIILGNAHLKVGPVKEKDADTIAVDIVASDNSLVTQTEIDRHSGRVEARFIP